MAHPQQTNAGNQATLLAVIDELDAIDEVLASLPSMRRVAQASAAEIDDMIREAIRRRVRDVARMLKNLHRDA